MNRTGEALATAHANALLAGMGLEALSRAASDHPALAWRRSGLMAVTGRPDGPGLVVPAALTAAADGALAAFSTLAPGAVLPRGAALLGERARLLGLRRGGTTSANGSCRLLATADGTAALNLPRDDDRSLLPALFEREKLGGWADIAAAARHVETHALVARARLLGLATADGRGGAAPVPYRAEEYGSRVRPNVGPLVVDLSALWAGPLAGALLAAAGARVVKVESVGRPDAARAGHPLFFDLLNGGKASVALDFATADGRAALHRLIDTADIVIEASRPRALAQLGIDAAAVAARGATWVSITAHGRAGEAAEWIGYGDDAAVAGGLADAMARGWGEPLFGGDAVADPLTGITAAFAGWAAWRQGGGRLVALALAEVVAHALALGGAPDAREWQAIAEADEASPYPLCRPRAAARPLGADTAAVLASL